MRRSDFSYQLPGELIAQQPLPERTASRLLCLDGNSGGLTDGLFADLPDLLQPGDLLVFNDTRVVPARLFGRKETGGRVEFLIERILDDHRALALVRASKRLRPGGRVELEDGTGVVVGESEGEFCRLCFDAAVTSVLEQCGHVPLPPYIERADVDADRKRYQTVYAKTMGAVAAPTAGLHFDDTLLEEIDNRGIRKAFVTLHVGAGTFQPVRCENLSEHRLHSEYMEVSATTCGAVAAAQREGGRIIAVGTTTVRSLEAAAQHGRLAPFTGETELFILPGFRFRVVDAMITNFHLPESTLLMLVSAFAGREHVLAAYEHAVEERYRFFSYGDAMFVKADPDMLA